MKILVINGSPKGEKSDTLKITRAFVEGMGETAEIVDTMKIDVRPCRGCFACWIKTPGKCIQKDDMENLLGKITAADLVIWSTPLYSYSVPANCKAVLDRLLPLTQMAQNVDEQGKTYHPTREKYETKSLLISGCGFPDRKNNFEALEFQFKRIFGEDCPMILCVEAPLLSIAEAKPLADAYLALAKRAGEEFASTGRISETTQSALDAPMYPPEQYRARTRR